MQALSFTVHIPLEMPDAHVERALLAVAARAGMALLVTRWPTAAPAGRRDERGVVAVGGGPTPRGAPRSSTGCSRPAHGVVSRLGTGGAPETRVSPASAARASRTRFCAACGTVLA
jgi:hypothetical protein